MKVRSEVVFWLVIQLQAVLSKQNAAGHPIACFGGCCLSQCAFDGTSYIISYYIILYFCVKPKTYFTIYS